MGLHALDMGFDARNLCLEGGDAGVKFLHRNGIEILFCKLHQRVAWLAWEEVVEVHGPNR